MHKKYVDKIIATSSAKIAQRTNGFYILIWLISSVWILKKITKEKNLMVLFWIDNKYETAEKLSAITGDISLEYLVSFLSLSWFQWIKVNNVFRLQTFIESNCIKFYFVRYRQLKPVNRKQTLAFLLWDLE